MQCRILHDDKTEGSNVANMGEMIRFSAYGSADERLSTPSKGNVPYENKQHGSYAETAQPESKRHDINVHAVMANSFAMTDRMTREISSLNAGVLIKE